MHTEKITIANELSLMQRLRTPFNPPDLSETYTESDLRTEWHSARDALKDVLDTFGVWNAYGEGDYFLDDTPNESRGIGVEITNPAFLTKAVVRAVRTVLRSFKDTYEVHFALSRDGRFFDVFVSREEVITSDEDLILNVE